MPASAVSEASLKAAVTSLPYLAVSHFRLCRQRLVPGQLKGNRFIIRVRGVKASQVPEAMESLQTKGFINYVGMQRFGKGGLRSDQLGLAYLQKNYERCVDLLLRQASQAGDQQERLPKWAEAFRRTNSADAALRRLPEGCWAERRLLQSLKKRQDLDGGTAWPVASAGMRMSWDEVAKEAFLSLPRTIRALYAHSYVDRLWNLAATERMTRFGLSLVRGDLVPDAQGGFKLLEEPDVSDMSNLLLPRPGSGMQLPANSVGSFMRGYLEYDSLDAEELTLEGPNDSFWQLTGCMRPVLLRPQNLSWHLEVNSGDPKMEHGNDFHALEPSKVTRATNHFSRARAKKEMSGSNLIMDFHLGPGQYATMALREVMRLRGGHPKLRHIVFSSESEADEVKSAKSSKKPRQI